MNPVLEDYTVLIGRRARVQASKSRTPSLCSFKLQLQTLSAVLNEDSLKRAFKLQESQTRTASTG